MILGAIRVAALPILLTLASASAGASGARAPVALTASPAHVELAGAGKQTVRVTNSGSSSVVLDVRRAGFALDLRGRPRIVGESDSRRSAARWLAFRPRTLTLAPGATGAVAVTSRPPNGAEPGDHDALVLFTTRRRAAGGVAVRVRMGVVVVVRAPGEVVHRVALKGVRVSQSGRARVLEAVVANRGNVTESFDRGAATVYLERNGRRLARLAAEPRALRPGTRGVLRFPAPRGVTAGLAVVRVVVVSASGRSIRRTFRLRL